MYTLTCSMDDQNCVHLQTYKSKLVIYNAKFLLNIHRFKMPNNCNAKVL